MAPNQLILLSCFTLIAVSVSEPQLQLSMDTISKNDQIYDFQHYDSKPNLESEINVDSQIQTASSLETLISNEKPHAMGESSLIFAYARPLSQVASSSTPGTSSSKSSATSLSSAISPQPAASSFNTNIMEEFLKQLASYHKQQQPTATNTNNSTLNSSAGKNYVNGTAPQSLRVNASMPNGNHSKINNAINQSSKASNILLTDNKAKSSQASNIGTITSIKPIEYSQPPVQNNISSINLLQNDTNKVKNQTNLAANKTNSVSVINDNKTKSTAQQTLPPFPSISSLNSSNALALQSISSQSQQSKAEPSSISKLISSSSISSAISSSSSSSTSTTFSSSQVVQSLSSSSSSLLSDLLSTFGSQPSTSIPPKKQIRNKQFTGIGLYHDVPLNFAQGEVFQFFGVILSPDKIVSQGSYQYNFLNIVFSQWGRNNQFRCSQAITDRSNLEFRISCKMEKAGTYLVSIFAGLQGQSSYKVRSIENQNGLFSLTLSFYQPPQPRNLQMKIINNSLTAYWDSNAAITNFTIYQKGGNAPKIEYILSNFHHEFRIPYADFQNFDPLTTFAEISHANSDDGTLFSISSDFSQAKSNISFEALPHGFDQAQTSQMQIVPQIPWKLPIGDKIKFNATFNEDFKNQVLITLPDRSIFKVYFIQGTKNEPPTKIIKAKKQVSLEVTFVLSGTHIIEINAATGLALLNRPIYVGNGLPLLPDHEDLLGPVSSKQNLTAPKQILENYIGKRLLNKTVNEPKPESSLDQKRSFLLELLNALRKEYKVSAITIDPQLNSLAQGHTDDMVAKNYFAHQNLRGEGPGQRAKIMKINSPIGENIVQSNSLIEGHLSLQRSAEHLINSINPGWTRVGIGITSNALKQYYIAFQFSSRDLAKSPLTSQQLSSYQKQVIELIISSNPSIKREDTMLSNDIKQWQNSQSGSTTSGASRVFDYLLYGCKNADVYKTKGGMSSSTFNMTYSDDWVSRLGDAGYLKPQSKYAQVGLGLKVGNSSLVEGVAVFTI